MPVRKGLCPSSRPRPSTTEAGSIVDLDLDFDFDFDLDLDFDFDPDLDFDFDLDSEGSCLLGGEISDMGR